MIPLLREREEREEPDRDRNVSRGVRSAHGVLRDPRVVRNEAQLGA